MSWGYLGKVPNRGDFLTHNVSGQLRELMFEWLQAALAVSREQLGDAWLDAYMTAPIWHFAASPGVLDEQGVAGTLIPSVDRVGRHFPFVVLGDSGGALLEAWRQPDWASSMEDCILAVLDDTWQEDAWRQRLDSIPLPVAEPVRLQLPGGEGNLALPAGVGEADWLRALLEAHPERMIWWTQGSAYVEPVTLLTEGLPKVGQFAAMLAGQWQTRGWRQGALVE